MSSPISDQELVEALGGAIDGRRITGVRRRPYRYATSAPLEEVTLLTADGQSGALILKDLSRDRLPANALAAKPEFLHEPRREIETYRRILDPAGIGPRLHAAVANPSGSRFWILIDKVAGVELWQIGEMEIWRSVAQWLGGFHARFGDRLDEVRTANPHLTQRNQRWFAFWRERASRALSASSDERAPELVAALAGGRELDGILASLPQAFLHGELYPSNVIVIADAEPLGVYPVDWEMAAIGPALLDLAALAGGYAEAEREAFTASYLDGLRAGGGREPSAPSEGLAACRLQLATQWLGWSADWRPPAEHSHDWLGEALELAVQLELA